MSGLAGHFASLGRFMAQHERRRADDEAAASELAAGAPAALGLAPGLELEWLGVAGYRLTFEGQTIYLDPYVSRVPLRALVRKRPALAAPSPPRRWLRARALPRLRLGVARAADAPVRTGGPGGAGHGARADRDRPVPGHVRAEPA